MGRSRAAGIYCRGKTVRSEEGRRHSEAAHLAWHGFDFSAGSEWSQTPLQANWE